ncbi:hypothetical protein ABZX51_005924 [Aspergillus tubingensis]
MSITKFPTRQHYDVVIVGGATSGSSIAWHLAANPDFKGSVLVVERDPSLEYSATKASNNCMRQQFATAINVQIAQYAADFVKRFGTEFPPDPRVVPFTPSIRNLDTSIYPIQPILRKCCGRTRSCRLAWEPVPELFQEKDSVKLLAVPLNETLESGRCTVGIVLENKGRARPNVHGAPKRREKREKCIIGGKSGLRQESPSCGI